MAELEQLIEQCTAQEREQILFAVFYVAFADGRFWREKPLLDRIRRELDIPAKTAGQLHNRAAGRRPKLTLPERQAARQLSYHYALEIAASDGKLHTRERQVAERLGDHLALSKEEVAAELDALDAGSVLFGIFGLFGHGGWVFFLFGERGARVWSPVMVVALAAIVLQYGFLLINDFVGKRKYLAVDPRMVFFQPMAWLWVLGWVLIIGGLVLENTTFFPRFAFIAIIALKTGLDLLLTYWNPMLFSR